MLGQNNLFACQSKPVGSTDNFKWKHNLNKVCENTSVKCQIKSDRDN